MNYLIVLFKNKEKRKIINKFKTSKKALKYYEYNTQGAAVRSYVTFQYIADGANLSQDNFTTTVLPNKNGIIDLKSYPDWETTKFEIVDNTLLYPPTDVDFNSLAMVSGLPFMSTSTSGLPVLDKASINFC